MSDSKTKYESYWGRFPSMIVDKAPLQDIWNTLTFYELTITNRSQANKVLYNGVVSNYSGVTQVFQRYDVVLDYIKKFMTPATDCIVDLGAGWGRNTFNMFLHNFPTNIDYYSLEYTEAGNQVAQDIYHKNVLPNSKKIDSHYILYTGLFDFNKPIIDFKKKYKNIIFLSHHSIEKVPQIKTAFFDLILGLDTYYTVIHMEPIGWQMMDINGPPYSVHLKYHNENLYQLLRTYEKNGKIKILEIYKNQYSLFSLKNTTSIVSWIKN